MVNILAGREVVREFIQETCLPFLLADEILRLINDESARLRLSAELESTTGILGGEGASARAADAILEYLSAEPSAGNGMRNLPC
jgi:lipid-A-disaccharide synthase